jgi:hypothetical protein
MEFTEFPKMARLSRDVIITEKIDGTNAQVFISPGWCSWYDDNTGEDDPASWLATRAENRSAGD